MGTKWTPGPWSVFIDDSGDKWTGWPLSIDAVTDPDKTVVRTGGHWPYEWETATSQREAVANAHLIAAAPDLYAALDDLLASYAEPDQQICCGGHGCGCRGASVRDLAEHHARAALAKARGQA